MLKSCLISVYLSLLILHFSSAGIANDQDKQVYIIYLGAVPDLVHYSPLSHYTSLLQELTGESLVEYRFVRSYKRSFTGFSAWLTEPERDKIASMDGVVSVSPNRVYQLQTTSSWNFLGLKEGKSTHRNPTESNTIVGVIDSGIWPESGSFSDNGFSPPPKKWRGTCEGGGNFSCNNKLIGARTYGLESVRDKIGHGSHRASTAAGNAVRDVSFFGLGKGIARGGVPAARIAVYKVCDSQGCMGDTILSAFDDAIADNVDIITISIARKGGLRFEADPIAIGAFHAMAKGILTVNSAGNSGPEPSTVSGTAPWIFTVAASNTNRAFVTRVVLGDGRTLAGRSVNSFDFSGIKYPLVYGGSASRTCDAASAGFCNPGCLDRKRVKGKIVFCDSPPFSNEVPSKGALGSIVKGSRVIVAAIFPFPVSVLSEEDYNTVRFYINSTRKPKAAVLKTETIFNQTAPVSGLYSSRGPNSIIPDLLKPDITAPGIEILAAYSPDAPLNPFDARRANYALLSGTSMSCPHVAGVAAYVKTFHPRWSPSMLQSAIMTTASVMNASTNIGAEFAYGSGHVNPKKAVDPGLVYETTKEDYLTLLCAMNYSVGIIIKVTGEKNISCSKRGSNLNMRDLNYPSMAAKVSSPSQPFSISFSRTVTNVGTPNSTYKAQVSKDNSKLQIMVVPKKLSFTSLGEKKSFRVTVSGSSFSKKYGHVSHVSASLVWSDGSDHIVTSPIVVYST